MKPTIGRIVHYAPNGKTQSSLEYYAAIITQVNSHVPVPGDGEPIETVELATFGPHSLYFHHKVPFSETLTAGCWTWPPRV